MAQLAYLHIEAFPGERRGSPRKRIRLETSGRSPDRDRTQVIVHDVSNTGLLLESSAELSRGEELDVILPLVGTRRVTVAWASGRFFGCEFADDIPAGPEAAAGAPRLNALPDRGSPEAVSLAAVQLHELSMAIERISKVLDRAMNQLSRRDR